MFCSFNRLDNIHSIQKDVSFKNFKTFSFPYCNNEYPRFSFFAEEHLHLELTPVKTSEWSKYITTLNYSSHLFSKGHLTHNYIVLILELLCIQVLPTGKKYFFYQKTCGHIIPSLLLYFIYWIENNKRKIYPAILNKLRIIEVISIRNYLKFPLIQQLDQNN